MKTVAVVTGSRADYGIYRPLLRRIKQHPQLRLRLLVTGMHLAPEFGATIDDIIADGFQPDARVEMLLAGDSPAAVAKSMGLGLAGFADVYARDRPDVLLALGDRFEMHAAVMASVPFGIPVAHIAGGVVTAGAIDEVFRHGITKAAHVHFVETEIYARRLVRMGEHPGRVHVTGALALDELSCMQPPSRAELEQRHGGPWDWAPLLITFHPVTAEREHAARHVEELLAALERCERPMIFTYPNADPGGRAIIRRINAFAGSHPRARVAVNLGFADYAGLMSVAAAMVGNSSSGLVEAPFFKLPVVNIGSRQQGRLAPANVISVPCERAAVARGLQQALADDFRAGLAGLVNPYGDGRAGERIIGLLERLNLDAALVRKEFYDGT